MEHRRERGLPLPAAPVSDRAGNPYDRGVHETSHHGGESSLPAREDEIDARPGALQRTESAEQPVETRHPHVVRGHRADAELFQDRPRLFRERNVARPRRDESDDPPAVLRP